MVTVTKKYPVPISLAGYFVLWLERRDGSIV